MKHPPLLQFVFATASRLHRWRYLLWLACAAGLALFLWGIVSDKPADGSALGGLLLLVWSGFLVTLAQMKAAFYRVPPEADAGLWSRFKWRALMAGVWILLAMMMLLAVLLILFTLRAVSASGIHM